MRKGIRLTKEDAIIVDIKLNEILKFTDNFNLKEAEWIHMECLITSLVDYFHYSSIRKKVREIYKNDDRYKCIFKRMENVKSCED